MNYPTSINVGLPSRDNLNLSDFKACNLKIIYPKPLFILVMIDPLSVLVWSLLWFF